MRGQRNASFFLCCHLGYPWLEIVRAQPFDTSMGLIEADLESWCVCERVPRWGYFIHPT